MSKFHCVCFSSINRVYREKISSDSENLIALILIFLAHKTKIKKIKKTKLYLDDENRNDKSAQVNIFSELLLTDNVRHYLLMNGTTSYIDFYTLITDTSYTSLNIWTGHWAMPGKKLSYVRRGPLHNGHSCPVRG